MSPRARPKFPHASASERSDFDLNPRHDAALDFEDKALEAMTPSDYDALGFMSGLEVQHEQVHPAYQSTFNSVMISINCLAVLRSIDRRCSVKMPYIILYILFIFYKK